MEGKAQSSSLDKDGILGLVSLIGGSEKVAMVNIYFDLIRDTVGLNADPASLPLVAGLRNIKSLGSRYKLEFKTAKADPFGMVASMITEFRALPP